jgi:hypothetical protein
MSQEIRRKHRSQQAEEGVSRSHREKEFGKEEAIK